MQEYNLKKDTNIGLTKRVSHNITVLRWVEDG